MNYIDYKRNKLLESLQGCCCAPEGVKIVINSVELKDCPFCGGKAISRKRRPDHIMNGKSFICCSVCKNKTGYYDSKEEAVAAWNKRVDNSMDDINYCPHCGKKL